MPRGPAPGWTAAAEHTLTAKPFIEAAYNAGFEIQFTWAGLTSRDRAATCKKGLFNAARRHDPPVSVSAEIEPASNGEWQVRFTLHDKKQARAYIVAKHGPDRAAWPYNARAKG